MFQRILVCLDRTKQSERILPYACAQVRDSGSRLMLLHVCKRDFFSCDITPSGQVTYYPIDLIEKDFQNRRNKALRYLGRTARRLAGMEIDAEPFVIEAVGTIPDSIVAFAKDAGVDLIAMASNGRTGLRRLWSGSVASTVARKTRLPVLLITPENMKMPRTSRAGDPDSEALDRSAVDKWTEDLDPNSALSGG